MTKSDRRPQPDADARAQLDRLLPHFLDTVIFTWIDGRLMALTERWTSGLPTWHEAPVYVITADNPDGRTEDERTNQRTLRTLLREVEAITTEANGPRHPWQMDRIGDATTTAADAITWWPAAGSSIDGSHVELSVVMTGIDRASAIRLGRRFHQLAVFELTEDLQTVLPCIDGVEPASAPRRRRLDGPCKVTYDHLESWWAAHENAAKREGIELAPRPRCARCGSRRLARVSYGLPIDRPAPWVTLGGCVVHPGQASSTCMACGHRF